MKKIFLILTCILILFMGSAHAARLPTVGGDSDAWGTVLNEYLNTSLGDYGISLNISKGNLTLGEKITFALGEVIDNIVDGWIKINGGLNVSENATFNGYVGIGTSSPSAKLDVEVSSGGAATIGSSWNKATGDYAIATGYNSTATGHYSTAMGRNTNASALSSIAIGTLSAASGSGSTAMGYNPISSGAYSTAIGYNTIASGGYSTAMGIGTIASGSSSTAMGSYTTASGDDGSIAMGYKTNASGSSSTAMGYLTNASGDYSTAMGHITTASGVDATAMGYRTNASGSYSTAMGHTTIASGDYSTAISGYSIASGQASFAAGYTAIASGYLSTAIGSGAKASGVEATAIGYDANASGTDATAIGRYAIASGSRSSAIGYNVTSSGSGSTAIGREIEAGANYVVAIGLDDMNGLSCSQANSMCIIGGNVGIGIASPAYLLEIANSATAMNVSGLLYANSTNVGIGTASPLTLLHIYDTDNPYLRIGTDAGGSNYLSFYVDGTQTGAIYSNDDIAVGLRNDTSPILVALPNGSIGIGTTTPVDTLEVNGQVGITGASRIRITKNDSQSIPDDTLTKIEFDDEDYDNLGEYDNSTNYRFTATKAGYYLVTANTWFDSSAWDAGEYGITAIYVNGTYVTRDIDETENAGTFYKGFTLSDILYLAVGDYVEIYMFQNSGAAINTRAFGPDMTFAIHRLS